MQAGQELPTVLTTAELCERWRCTPRTLERMARDGRIRRVKLRGGVRYPTDEVLRIELGEAQPARIGQQVAEVPSVYAVAEVGPLPPGPLPRARGKGRTMEGAMNCAPTAQAIVGAQFIAPVASSPLPRTGEGLGEGDLPLSLPSVVERSWYTVCIAHRKGGVAKSTTTWYLARELGRAGKRVLLRDLDPQQGLRDILRDHGCEDGRYSKTIALVQDGDPLPFTPDVELIDTPPALDDSLPGVARADAVIVPAMPEHQAVRALERMLLVLKETRHEHPFTRVLGILPVRVKPRWTEHAAFMRQIEVLGERFGHPVLPSIPESRAVLTYSLRGRLWRPTGEVVLADLARHEAMRTASLPAPGTPKTSTPAPGTPKTGTPRAGAPSSGTPATRRAANRSR
jgi:excisionase family DNA binding protein